MELGDFLKNQGGSSWNCSTMPADWCMALGHPDYAAAWRDITDPHACEATTAHDGLLTLWQQGIGGALPVVEVLEPGDIAVIALGPLEAGAIWTGERFAIRTAKGLHFSAEPRLLKAWRPRRG